LTIASHIKVTTELGLQRRNSLGDINMTDKLDVETKEDVDLRQALDRVRWPIAYGCVTILVKCGKATLVKVERTIKLD